jgi:hypothetical protein
MKKPASATVSGRPPLASSQLQLVRGGENTVVVVPVSPSLKSERVQ